MLIIGGGMAFTFAKAQGGEIGKSLLEADRLDYAREMIEKAKRKGVQLLLPVDTAFGDYGRIFLSPRQEELFLHGVRLDPGRIRHPDTDQPLRVYGGDRFLGLARIDREKDELVIVKLFITMD